MRLGVQEDLSEVSSYLGQSGLEGRAFQREGLANAKTLMEIQAWHNL